MKQVEISRVFLIIGMKTKEHGVLASHIKQVRGNDMDIKKTAVAGTLESSDCIVTVEPGEGSIEFDLDSSVIRQYGKQIRKVALETLERIGVTDAKVHMVDKGALDCTIKARVECACYRAAGFEGQLPWGGDIR